MRPKNNPQTRIGQSGVLLLAVLLMIAVLIVLFLSLEEAGAREPGDYGYSSMDTPSDAAVSVSRMESRRLVRRVADDAPRKSETESDRSLSPYFFIPGGDAATDRLPLKSTRADIDIRGVIAGVKVTQVYKNEGRTTLEAIYVFPGSTRAAVHAMKMTIGERVVEAEIKERQAAREEYNQAKQQGKTASLLEQQRPNVFQMNVANIRPGDEIKVEMRYTELLVPEDGVYEFIYPTVVGPRYSETPEKNAPDTEKWVKNPYLHAGEPSPFSFGLDCSIRGGIPVSDVSSPSHDLWVSYPDASGVEVDLDERAENADRDFVLRYRLQGNRIESGLLLYPGESDDENFFLLMMEPPERVKKTDIVPREYIFIVDVSGSMHGYPLDISKKLMRKLLGSMGHGDYFNVLLFASGNSVLSPHSLPATKANIDKAIRLIDHQHGGGGTQLLPALKRALALPCPGDVSRTVVIATDGYVSIEKEAFELIRNRLGDANFFPFGIGSSVNRHLIEGMARAGMGEPFVILKQEEAKAKAERFLEIIQSPVLQDIRVDFKGFDAYDVEPKSMPDLFAKRPLVMFGKYHGKAQGKIVVGGRAAFEDYENVIRVEAEESSTSNRALRQLWARKRIERLADMNKLFPGDERIREVTSLGLKYSLLTDYTSFIAVDSEVRGKDDGVTVKQPLPLPRNVSDLAVDGLLAGGSLGNRGAGIGGGGMGGIGRGYATGSAAPQSAVRTRNLKKSGESGILGRFLSKEKSTLEALSAVAEEAEKSEDRASTKDERKEPKPARFALRSGKFFVSGPLALSVVKNRLNRLLPELRRVCETEWKKQPNLRELKILIDVDPSGRIGKVKILSGGTHSREFTERIEKMVRTVSFNRTQGSGLAVITWTLHFDSKN